MFKGSTLMKDNAIWDDQFVTFPEAIGCCGIIDAN